MLRNFAEKVFLGYQTMEKACEVIDEGKFQQVLIEYKKRVTEASSEEERRLLLEELENIKRSREEKLSQETIIKGVRDKLLAMFGEIF